MYIRCVRLHPYDKFFSCPQSYHFERDDVALPGFAKFFKEASDSERDHAHKLMSVSSSSKCYNFYV